MRSMGSQGSTVLNTDSKDPGRTVRLAHRSFRWFCHAAAQLLMQQRDLLAVLYIGTNRE